MKPSRFLQLIACAASAALILLAASCGGNRKPETAKTEIPSLDYAGKLCNLDTARNIELTDDGLILAHSSETENASPIYVYSTDGTYKGTLKSNGADIVADAMFVDANDLVCAIDRAAVNVRRFKTDGTKVDSVPLTADSRGLTYSDSGLALRVDGTLLVASAGIRGKLSLTLLDNSFSVVRSLSGPDLARILDQSVGPDAGDQATVQSVAAGPSGEALLVLAFGEGPYDTRDGILELDADLAFVRYVGDDKLFNAPESACVDANGYRYVADTWNRRLCAYDSNWNLVAVSARDRRGKPLVVNPHCVRAKGDSVYVVAYGKERTFEAAALHLFKAWRPQPAEPQATMPPTDNTQR